MFAQIWAIVGPSGVGKTTLVKNLLALDPAELGLRVEQAVSFTTRAPREGEVDGSDYHFITQDIFENLLASGGLAENIEVGSTKYGLTRDEFDSRLNRGIHVVVIIEPHGIEQIQRLYGRRVKTVFLKPPTPETCHERMVRRGTPESEIARRSELDRRIVNFGPRADFWLEAKNEQDTLNAMRYLLTHGKPQRRAA